MISLIQILSVVALFVIAIKGKSKVSGGSYGVVVAAILSLVSSIVAEETIKHGHVNMELVVGVIWVASIIIYFVGMKWVHERSFYDNSPLPEVADTKGGVIVVVTKKIWLLSVLLFAVLIVMKFYR